MAASSSVAIPSSRASCRHAISESASALKCALRDSASVANAQKKHTHNVGLGEAAKLPAVSGVTGYNGWAKIPMSDNRKLIVQWGQGGVNTAGSGEVYTSSLPIAFPTIFAQVFVTHNNPEDAGVGVGSAAPVTLSTFTTRAIKLSQTGATLSVLNGNVSFRYIAIGF